MANPNDVNADELIKALAKDLKTVPEVKAPTWAHFVKTGHFKERPPVQQDWWHIRSAAVFRTVYRLGPVGTSKLRTKYGGKKNNGMAGEHAYRGSGGIIRRILQQLEKAGLLSQVTKSGHKGRVLTPKGQSFINSVAKKVDPKMVARKPLTAEQVAADVKASKPKRAAPKKKAPATAVSVTKEDGRAGQVKKEEA